MITSHFHKRWFFLRTETDRVLFASIVFSMLMVLTGIAYTGRPIFLFLVWNLFLAYIPYAVSNWVQNNPGWVEDKRKFAAAFAVWLLFVPNSFYLITDIFHLGEIERLPLWFDLVLLFSFAWNGLLLGVVSIRQMEKTTAIFFNQNLGNFFVYPVMWLNALGIYIGRYLRYNSWDIVTNPVDLASDIVRMLAHPLQFKYAWGMVFCFSLFMTLMYEVLKRLGNLLQK